MAKPTAKFASQRSWWTSDNPTQSKGLSKAAVGKKQSTPAAVKKAAAAAAKKAVTAAAKDATASVGSAIVPLTSTIQHQPTAPRPGLCLANVKDKWKGQPPLRTRTWTMKGGRPLKYHHHQNQMTGDMNRMNVPTEPLKDRSQPVKLKVKRISNPPRGTIALDT
ncbi:hypothetical protein QFC22_006686 [Naganishia vaughanmartiniae]|uniref:Uncharacterized protein n=1 Tax=Naganishia vaughanmartiniae TaxID=1424756 RepID=A0ACC2WGD5_9TREE|nr:hypothetical protein QFC22_006686 [Naganishia vaughanmartiniae]